MPGITTLSTNEDMQARTAATADGIAAAIVVILPHAWEPSSHRHVSHLKAPLPPRRGTRVPYANRRHPSQAGLQSRQNCRSALGPFRREFGAALCTSYGSVCRSWRSAPRFDLEAPMIARCQQRPINLFRPIGRGLVRRRGPDSILIPAHERIRNHGIKNRVDTIGIDVINKHCQFRLSFRSSSVEYWFEKGIGVCGASRSSACELDTTDPKVNSGANRQPPGQRLAVAVRVCEGKRFVMCFRSLSSSSARWRHDRFCGAQPPDHV